MSNLVTKLINSVSGLSQKTGGAAKVDYTVADDMKKYARQMAAEGIVLLKNNNTLPIKPAEVVSVFGRVQYDYFYVGYGSGGDVKTPYKINLIQGILNNGKIKLNTELAAYYETWCRNNIPDEGYWGHWPLNFAEMPLTESVVKKAAEVSDLALVVIGRAAGEDREQKLIKGGYYLTDDETDMLKKVTAAFEKTAVIIDSGNVMDLSWVNAFDNKITAVLFAGLGGMESGNAVADVLSGAVNPSGRLTDTVAINYADYPSSENFGARDYNNYREDIYVGYRYFETFCKSKVLFPFGYGLSYTDFETAGAAIIAENDITVSATVKNVGNAAGKEVMQIYVEPPQGKLCKPLKNLVAFGKTDEILPSETCKLDIPFSKYLLMSYDDGGVTGHKACYVLEEGEYKIYIGKNVRETQLICAFNVDKTVFVQKEEICAVEKQNAIDVLYPMVSADGSVAAGWRKAATRTVDLKKRITDNLPEKLPACNKQITLADVKCGKATLDEFTATLTPEEMELLIHGDYKMNSPLGANGNAGAFGGITEGLRAKGIPPVIVTDGPSGIRLMCSASLLPSGTTVASSWNTALAEKLYECIGAELLERGSDVLLGPGMNIHRDPLCGRNFEYYSEDPVVSGKIGAAVVRGIQSKGVSACPKHFACNNQETNRNGEDARLSERALREIYLKGFEICLAESTPKNLMLSYNLINGVHSYYCYELCTVLLRKEWGYAGNVMTDWWTRKGQSPDFPQIKNNAYRVRSGGDLLMPGGARLFGFYDNSAVKAVKCGALTVGELQRSAKNILGAMLSMPSVADKIK